MIVAWDAQHLQLFLSFLDSSFVVLVFSYFTNSCLQSFSITRFSAGWNSAQIKTKKIISWHINIMYVCLKCIKSLLDGALKSSPQNVRLKWAKIGNCCWLSSEKIKWTLIFANLNSICKSFEIRMVFDCTYNQ